MNAYMFFFVLGYMAREVYKFEEPIGDRFVGYAVAMGVAVFIAVIVEQSLKLARWLCHAR